MEKNITDFLANPIRIAFQGNLMKIKLNLGTSSYNVQISKIKTTFL